MSLIPPLPITVVHLFPPVLKALVDLMEQLSPEQWQTRPAGGEWTVKDTAAHLLGGEVGILSRQRDGYRVSHGTMTEWDELVAFINDINGVWVQAAHRLSPRLLCDLMRLTGEQVCAYFATLDPMAIGGAVNWAGPEPAPLWFDLAREYTERWHHQQQIRDAIGRPGLTEPAYFAPVLDAFVRAMPHTYRAIEAAEGATVALTIEGAAGGRWRLVRQQGGWRLYVDRGSSEPTTAEVTIDEDTAWRLFTKGVDADQAARSVRITGDTTLGRHTLSMVSVLA